MSSGDIEKTNYATDNKDLSGGHHDDDDSPSSPGRHVFNRSDEAAVGTTTVGTVADFGEKGELKQGLHQRHIQMIALAGAIGTGLFLGSGGAIEKGGPLGALLGYFFVGVLVVGVVFSIAELRYVYSFGRVQRYHLVRHSFMLIFRFFLQVPSSRCQEPSSGTPSTLSIPPSPLPKAGIPSTTTSSPCLPS